MIQQRPATTDLTRVGPMAAIVLAAGLSVGFIAGRARPLRVAVRPVGSPQHQHDASAERRLRRPPLRHHPVPEPGR